MTTTAETDKETDKDLRRQSMALLAGYAAWGVFWGGWGALLPAMKTLSGSSDATLGVVLICVAVGALPAMLVVGPLVDRFGNRALMASLGLFGLAILSLCLARSPAALAIGLLLVGATSGAVDVALNAGVAAMESATGRRLFNKAHAAFPLAVVIASPAVGVARQAGATPASILMAMAAVVLAVALANLRGRVRPRREEEGPRPRRRLSRMLLLLGLVGAGIHIIENAVEQWSAIFLEGDFGAMPAVGSLGPAVYMGMLFVGRMIAHKYGERLTDRQMLVVTGLSASAGMALAAVAPHSIVAIAGFAVAGLGMAAGIPTIFSLTGRTVNEAERGAAIATVTVVAYGGYLVSPPIVGLMADAIGLRGAWLVLAAMALVLVGICRGAVPAPAAASSGADAAE